MDEDNSNDSPPSLDETPEVVLAPAPSAPFEPEEPAQPIQAVPLATETSTHQCWICYAMQEDDPRMAWVKPCKCRGGTKWVHQTCLQKWIDEKIKEDRRKVIACPQCRTEYLLHYPAMGYFTQLLDIVDMLLDYLSSVLVDCYILGSIYWSAVTYGAMTLIHVGGVSSINLIKSVNPTLLLAILPIIPVTIFTVGSLDWDFHLGRLLVNFIMRIPIVCNVFPNAGSDSDTSMDGRLSDRMQCTRKFVSSIFLPMASKLCGQICYPNVTPVFRQFVAGCLTFICVKSTITFYHRQHIRKKLSDMKILDYTEENIELFGANH